MTDDRTHSCIRVGDRGIRDRDHARTSTISMGRRDSLDMHSVTILVQPQWVAPKGGNIIQREVGMSIAHGRKQTREPNDDFMAGERRNTCVKGANCVVKRRRADGVKQIAVGPSQGVNQIREVRLPLGSTDMQPAHTCLLDSYVMPTLTLVGAWFGGWAVLWLHELQNRRTAEPCTRLIGFGMSAHHRPRSVRNT